MSASLAHVQAEQVRLASAEDQLDAIFLHELRAEFAEFLEQRAAPHLGLDHATLTDGHGRERQLGNKRCEHVVIDQMLGERRVAAPAEARSRNDVAISRRVVNACRLLLALHQHLALVIGRLAVTPQLGHVDLVAEAVDGIFFLLGFCQMASGPDHA
jgi:hypothetical protein